MPTLAYPSYLLAAGAAAAVVVALHLLAWRRPTPVRFPTARFVPPSAVRAVSRAVRPTDLLLLVVRALALLLTGLALARPVIAPPRSGNARVLVVDASRRVTDVPAAIDSARARAAGTDEVVWIRVDSVATVYRDSMPSAPSAARGVLGAGLVAAIREGERLSRTRDSVSIVVVSPFAADSWSRAMLRLRDEWRGALSVVRVPVRPESPGGSMAASPQVRGRAAAVLPPVDDPVGAALAVAIDSVSAPLRVTRHAVTADDSAWARAGGVLVWWPRAARTGENAPPPSAPRTAILSDGERSVAGHFSPLPDVTSSGVAILRWSDGQVAATEQAFGAGCLRTVAVDVPASGDEVLRPGFSRLVRALASPCGGGTAGVVPDSLLSRWAAGPTQTGVDAAQANAAAIRSDAQALNDEPSSPALTRAILAVVALLLALEWWLRRARAAQVEGTAVPASTRREAA